MAQTQLLSAGMQALLLSVPDIGTFLSSYPSVDEFGESLEVPSVFRNKAPQNAVLPYVVWHHIVTPFKYNSCGETGLKHSEMQIDFHAQDVDQLDVVMDSFIEHLSFIDGVYGAISISGVLLDDAGAEENEDVQSDGDITNPVRKLMMNLHWEPLVAMSGA